MGVCLGVLGVRGELKNEQGIILRLNQMSHGWKTGSVLFSHLRFLHSFQKDFS